MRMSKECPDEGTSNAVVINDQHVAAFAAYGDDVRIGGSAG